MVAYRRNFVPGGTYFFTAALADRASTHLVDHIALLLRSFDASKQQRPYKEIATVILPDHLHTIWRLPYNDFDYPGRWKAVKSLFTRLLVKSGVRLVKNNRGEYRVWQRRYWEHTISDEQDLRSHIDYIHYNPVKHGYVDEVSAWPYSSFHRYVAAGILPIDWGGGIRDSAKSNFGE